MRGRNESDTAEYSLRDNTEESEEMVETRQSGTRSNERERGSYPLQLVFASPLPVATSGFWNAILFLAVSRGMVTTAMIRPSGEGGRGRDG